MKNAKIFFFMIFASLFLSVSSIASAQGYEALKGVRSAKAVFDVRIGNPQSAALHMKLIHQTYKDLTSTPAVVGVRLASTRLAAATPTPKLAGFTPEDNKA